MASQPASKSAENSGGVPTLAKALKIVKSVNKHLSDRHTNEVANVLIDILTNDPGAGQSGFNYFLHYKLDSGIFTNSAEIRNMLRQLGWTDPAPQDDAEFSKDRDLSVITEMNHDFAKVMIDDEPFWDMIKREFMRAFDMTEDGLDQVFERFALAVWAAVNIRRNEPDFDFAEYYELRLKSRNADINALVREIAEIYETYSSKLADVAKQRNKTETEPAESDRTTAEKTAATGPVDLARRAIDEFGSAAGDAYPRFDAEHGFLMPAVLFADSVIDHSPDFDVAGHFGLQDIIDNHAVWAMVGVYRRLKKQAADAGESESDQTAAFAMAERLHNARVGPADYVVCLAFQDLSVRFVKGRPNLPDNLSKTVFSQTRLDDSNSDRVCLSLYHFLTPEDPDNGRMVVRSRDMIGNERISAADIMDMVQKGRIKIAAWNASMESAFTALHAMRQEEEAEAEARLNDSVLSAVKIPDKHPQASRNYSVLER